MSSPARRSSGRLPLPPPRRAAGLFSRLPRLRVAVHAALLAPLALALVGLVTLVGGEDEDGPTSGARARAAARADALALAPSMSAAVLETRVAGLAPGEAGGRDAAGDGEDGDERGPIGLVIDGRGVAGRAAAHLAGRGAGGRADTGPGASGETGGEDRERTGPAGVDLVVAGAATRVGTEEPPERASEEAGWPVGTGITGDYFDHAVVLERVPQLGGIAPTFTRVDASIDFMSDESFGLPFFADTFIVRWTGWFLAETEGTYRFKLGSDDGARLELDNVVVIEHDGLHPHEEREAEVKLGAGLHPIRVVFFENYGYSSAQLSVQVPGASGGDGMVVVPQRWLFPADTTGLLELPVVDQVKPDHAPERAAVEVLGRGFGDLPGYASVRFGDATARILEAAPTRLLVEVPEGTDGGPLVVTVGGQVTPAVAFTVDGVFGLHARFRDTGPDIAEWVSLGAQSAVDHERIDGQVVFPDQASLRLPFAAHGVIGEWRGDLWVHRPGRHTLWVTSDDGARLWLDGVLVLDDHELHAPREMSAEVVLGWGRHALVLEYFQGPGGAALQLDIAADEQPRRPVPRGWLTPPPAVRTQRPPHVARIDPPRGAPGDQVVIVGESLTDPALAPPVVTLGGVRCEVVSPGWSSLVVRIPPGNPDSGPVVVRVGPHESPAVPFEVTGFGITGEYWDLEQDLGALPEVDQLGPPTHVRIDPQVEFQEEAGFKLPFHPDTFVARWRGTFVAPVEGTYRFVVGSDDGTRLTVAGQRLLEDSGLHAYIERAAELWLPAGPTPLALEFFDNYGEARSRLMVVPPGGEQIVVPRTWLRPAAQ